VWADEDEEWEHDDADYNVAAPTTTTATTTTTPSNTTKEAANKILRRVPLMLALLMELALDVATEGTDNRMDYVVQGAPNESLHFPQIIADLLHHTLLQLPPSSFSPANLTTMRTCKGQSILLVQ
jgi:hypothetical protein